MIPYATDLIANEKAPTNPSGNPRQSEEKSPQAASKELRSVTSHPPQQGPWVIIYPAHPEVPRGVEGDSHSPAPSICGSQCPLVTPPVSTRPPEALSHREQQLL